MFFSRFFNFLIRMVPLFAKGRYSQMYIAVYQHMILSRFEKKQNVISLCISTKSEILNIPIIVIIAFGYDSN